MKQGVQASVGLMFGVVPDKSWYVSATETEDQAEFAYQVEKALAAQASQPMNRN